MPDTDLQGYEEIKAAHRYAPAGATQRAPLDVLMFRDIKPQLNSNALIKDLLGTSGMTVMYGDSNTAKTFFAVDLGLHVALGWEWFGRRVNQSGVLYIAAEGGSSIQNRVSAFRQHYGEIGDVPFGMITTAVDLCNNKAETDGLIATIQKMVASIGTEVGLVVVDTLSRALAGGDESSSQDMGAYVQNVDRIRSSTNAQVLSIHHTGKNHERGARGHSLLRAAADTEIEVTREEAAGYSVARVTKQRDLPMDGDSIAFRLETVVLGVNEYGEDVKSCVVKPASDLRTQGPALKPLKGQAKRALEQLHICVADNGRSPPKFVQIPEDVVVVTLTEWHDYLAKANIINIKGNPRQQICRIRESLEKASLIEIHDDYVWPTP